MKERKVYAVKKPVKVTAYQTTQDKVINTLEGKLLAKKGDWIVTGVNGEQYPVKSEIFEKTYEIISFLDEL
ncbi:MULTISPECIES: hypothetical protein [Aerococcus]|uniref:Uncharacterized protein n=3 Tax=Aerococcus TaxID=1375 RepID=A0A178HFR0_9LACT|nr:MULTISPECIES: hypothetical protein [Aerococcus]KAA9218307.1 hypothetical protein F6I39_07485 [Aerococcus loyolae]KAA9264244.1 hypothetical protein F6I19_07795 [Aerococcus loyolae]MCY3026380.1 hypothetical protein [Aerococcus loyolae]MCY3027890.1 hypothetical protein [Aerococcus loyolae]MCY3029854.1 hypothetical protein [Aerococcus loyolae]